MSLLNHDKQKDESKIMENALLEVSIDRGVSFWARRMNDITNILSTIA